MSKAVALICACGVAYAEPVIVAALGDSLTQGFGLPAEQGFVPQMQQWLRDQGADVVLINAGVSGDTTAGGLSRVAWTLTPDVDGMIVALGGNDVLRGLDPALSREHLSGILRTASESGVQVMLVGMQAPGNYGADYKTAFDAIYPELAAEYSVPLAPSFFAGLPVEDPAALRALMQPDGIHPNVAGVRQIVETLGPQVMAFIETIAE